MGNTNEHAVKAHNITRGNEQRNQGSFIAFTRSITARIRIPGK